MIVAACAGFLVAVLWMDLIFDSQVLSHRGPDDLPDRVLASIAGYYHRATTTSRPMNYLIAAVMVVLLAVLAFRWVEDPGWPMVLSTGFAGAPILLAALHTVPSAKRLGSRIDDTAGQSRLARAICRDHLLCLASMSSFVAVWVTA